MRQRCYSLLEGNVSKWGAEIEKQIVAFYQIKEIYGQEKISFSSFSRFGEKSWTIWSPNAHTWSTVLLHLIIYFWTAHSRPFFVLFYDFMSSYSGDLNWRAEAPCPEGSSTRFVTLLHHPGWVDVVSVSWSLCSRVDPWLQHLDIYSMDLRILTLVSLVIILL